MRHARAHRYFSAEEAAGCSTGLFPGAVLPPLMPKLMWRFCSLVAAVLSQCPATTHSFPHIALLQAGAGRRAIFLWEKPGLQAPYAGRL
jgi:hypothetical protein